MQALAEIQSDLPTPKYRIGDVVWSSGTTATTAQHSCPDCLGTGQWKVFTPGGSELTASCQRCAGYSSDIPSLKYKTWVPCVRSLTIGSVTAKSHKDTWSDRDQVEYMAIETGVGSGTIYYERSLFPTEEAARKASEAMAAVENAKLEDKPERLEGKRFSNLNLLDASVALGREQLLSAWWAYRHLRDEVRELVSPEDGSPGDREDIISQLRWRLEFEAKHRSSQPLLDMADAVERGELAKAQAALAKAEALLLTVRREHAEAMPEGYDGD